ncbi:MAG: HAD family hydrolase, partial [Candidatus Methylomirabilia bacterium]
MIEAVTFDFWQTLMADTPERLAQATALRLDGVGAVLATSGHPVERSALEAAYEASAHRLETVWREHRDLSYRRQVAIFLDTVAPDLPDRLVPDTLEKAVQAYITPVLSYPPVPFPGVLEAVHALGRQGLVLCVVSNTGRTPGVILRQVLADVGLLDRFRVTSFSDEVGFRKPRPEIFHLTLERAGVDPARAVHVGDSPEADIAGARAAGMRAIHFAPDGCPESEIADLVVHGLAAL